MNFFMSNTQPQVKCPICDKKDTWQMDNKFKPFCSERCKLIDLGEWASDNRSIQGETLESENKY